ncbi:MAG: hypothetical protein FJ108_00255 [Deltaproteobacteria bacterium]|nr:hypothetical protein [Deltaproteobacteria bacterium]
MAILESELRQARNWSADAKGSIHDDATAGKLGFRGGTVAGSIHMDQFPPLLLGCFGERFFRDGALSLYFLNATVDREPVRAFAEEPSSGSTQVRIWMKREDGLDVSEGTASVGDASKSALRERDLRACDPGELRMLRGLAPGTSLGETKVRLGPERQRERIERGLCSGPLGWYTGPSPFGGPIAAPSALVELLWAPPTKALRPHVGEAVGLFGAIEVAHLAGPVFLDQTYTVTGQVVAVGQSPKTETLWFDALASDAGGRGVASMRMLLRFMKASSPLYS